MESSCIGLNLRVTHNCSQGSRQHMEDTFCMFYHQIEEERDPSFAYFGIFDGHGGPEAALYAKEHLHHAIISQDGFWSQNDDDVLHAIHTGFCKTHFYMWKEYLTWPKTAIGLPSTSGTTATIAFIKNQKLYVGHVGDSCIVLGYQEEGGSKWKARPLTRDHKPESEIEGERIRLAGGKVISKSGVPRVVWNRPRLGTKGPVRRSTQKDEIPFLAVARALGDFWSYNEDHDKFVVSPDPDVGVFSIDLKTNRCLILGTDGLWNMLTAQAAVSVVQSVELNNQKSTWINPSKTLVERAVKLWTSTRQKADNTSAITVLLDPPGLPTRNLRITEKVEEPSLEENSVTENSEEMNVEYAEFDLSIPLEINENSLGSYTPPPMSPSSPGSLLNLSDSSVSSSTPISSEKYGITRKESAKIEIPSENVLVVDVTVPDTVNNEVIQVNCVSSTDVDSSKGVNSMISTHPSPSLTVDVINEPIVTPKENISLQVAVNEKANCRKLGKSTVSVIIVGDHDEKKRKLCNKEKVQKIEEAEFCGFLQPSINSNEFSKPATLEMKLENSEAVTETSEIVCPLADKSRNALNDIESVTISSNNPIIDNQNSLSRSGIAKSSDSG